MKRSPLNRKTPLRSRPKVRPGKQSVRIGDKRARQYLVDGSPAAGPIIQRLASTARAPGAAAAKVGEMRSPTLRAFVKLYGMCPFGDESHPAAELHHWPPTGANGVVIDLLAVPACRLHHNECHARVISEERQSAEVSRFWRFLISRKPEVARAALREMTEG